VVVINFFGLAYSQIDISHSYPAVKAVTILIT
jgi:hypothetical protein